MIAEPDTHPEQRLRYGFKLCLSRTPQSEELATLKTALETRLEYFRANPDEASKLLEIGTSPIPQQLDRAELAAYTTVARILLNLSEFITKS